MAEEERDVAISKLKADQKQALDDTESRFQAQLKDLEQEINQDVKAVKEIVIDPIGFMADVNLSNNSFR